MVGYARVSTADQSEAGQGDALHAAGASRPSGLIYHTVTPAAVLLPENGQPAILLLEGPDEWDQLLTRVRNSSEATPTPGRA